MMSHTDFITAVQNYIFLSLYDYGRCVCNENELEYHKFHINYLQAKGINKKFSKCAGLTGGGKKCNNSRRYGSNMCYKHLHNKPTYKSDVEYFKTQHVIDYKSNKSHAGSDVSKSLLGFIETLICWKKEQLNFRIMKKFNVILKTIPIPKSRIITYFDSITEKQKIKQYINKYNCLAERRLGGQCGNRPVRGNILCRLHVKNDKVKLYKIDKDCKKKTIEKPIAIEYTWLIPKTMDSCETVVGNKKYRIEKNKLILL